MHGFNNYYDDKIVLDPDDDIAHCKWGGTWRIPTKEELQELLSECTWTLTTQNEVEGYLITSNVVGYTDHSIFIPLSGCRNENYLQSGGVFNDYYMSSTVSTNDASSIWTICKTPRGKELIISSRKKGYQIRPVCP